MSKTQTKPTLVKIGKHYVNPENVTGIKQAKEGLYIIMLKDNPEPSFPLWLSGRALESAKKYFEILGEDVEPD
jgi:hypothetical protein